MSPKDLQKKMLGLLKSRYVAFNRCVCAVEKKEHLLVHCGRTCGAVELAALLLYLNVTFVPLDLRIYVRDAGVRYKKESFTQTVYIFGNFAHRMRRLCGIQSKTMLFN